MSDEKKVKVHMLKNAGPYKAGDVVEVSEAEAKDLSDGVKGMSEADFAKHQAKQADVAGMSVAEMNAKGLKNVVSPDLGIIAQAEKAALDGKPIASSEPLTVTGGVTPPTLVHPALAKAAGHDYTDVKDVKGLKKPEAAKAEKK